MTLRWWLLLFLPSFVAVSSLHLWRHRHRPRPAPVADFELEDTGVVPPPPRLLYERPPAQPSARKPATTGMATVRGRVMGVPQAPREDTEEEVTLVVSDEENEIEVALEPDGSFAVELAPGTYRFHAQLDENAATLDAVTVGPEEDREVVLQLAGSVITGTLHPPGGEERGLDEGGDAIIDLRVEIRVSGESTWSESEDATTEENQFTITGLDAGKSYDLRLTADGFRPAELMGISVPSAGLLANLVRPARLRGGLGIARGESCPINEVTIEVDDEEAQVVTMDHFCRFESDDLPPVQRVRVRVSEGDWSFDVLVDIPPHGDPPFLCLRSFCREPDADELSTLEISLSDNPDKTFSASLGYGNIGVNTSAAKGEIARFSEIPSGITAWVTVFARSCRPIDQSLVLQPGINRLNVTCQKR